MHPKLLNTLRLWVRCALSLVFALCSGLIWLGALPSSGAQGASGDPSKLLTDPAIMAKALEDRGQRQIAAGGSIHAFHDFKFADKAAASGILFRHGIVEDAGKFFRGNHYDHGNAVAAADVDGDGRVDLYFTTQLGTNRLYRSLGGGRFEDVTERAGVGLVDQVSVGASFGDLNNDGLPDLFVTTVRHGNHLFQNLGGGRFADVTKEAGVVYSGHSLRKFPIASVPKPSGLGALAWEI